jgi:hypothetical protein
VIEERDEHQSNHFAGDFRLGAIDGFPCLEICTAPANAAPGAPCCSLPTATRFTRNAGACAVLSERKLKQGGARVRRWLPLV